LIVRPASNGRFRIRSGSEREVGVTAEEWVLAATVFLSGLASGLLGMLSAIMRPMLAAMDGRDFRNFMEAFLRYAGHSWGKVFNFAWSIGMTIGPVVALVLLWDDPGSTSFVLTAIGLGIVIVGVLIVSNVWKTPTYNVILSWDPAALRRTGRRDGGAISRSTGSNWR
jgi:MFS family permease